MEKYFFEIWHEYSTTQIKKHIFMRFVKFNDKGMKGFIEVCIRKNKKILSQTI